MLRPHVANPVPLVEEIGATRQAAQLIRTVDRHDGHYRAMRGIVGLTIRCFMPGPMT